MKKEFKKVLVILMTAIMLFQLVGCSDKQEVSKTNAGKDSSLLISEEPVELTMFFRASKSPDGQWDLMKKAAEMTNVFAKCIVSKSNSNIMQSFNLMIASGDIADLVSVEDDVQFINYGIEGAFVPLNKYFDTLMPNFKAFLKENPEVERRITASDGNIYYLPVVPGGSASTGWFIRQDWLDKLGLEAPKTTEELHKVLTAFKTQDPNGNGKQDEVPYFSQDKMKALFPLWGANQSWYTDNGKILYGPLQPEYKTAIENIIKWYNEGLLDREILTRTSSPRDKMLMDNIGGVTHDWFGSTARYNDTLKEDIPGFSLRPIPPVEGVELNRREACYNYGWGVYSGSKHLEEAIKFLDFWFSEEGEKLINFGEEGVHWTMVDGEPKFTDNVLKAEVPQKVITEFGCQIGIGYVQDFNYEKQWINQIAIEGMEMYEEGNWYAEQMPPLYMRYTPEESKEYKLLSTQIDTYTDEMFQKWILGAEDFGKTYDKYLAELEKLGISKLLKLQQTAYNRYLKG